MLSLWEDEHSGTTFPFQHWCPHYLEFAIIVYGCGNINKYKMIAIIWLIKFQDKLRRHSWEVRFNSYKRIKHTQSNQQSN